MSTAPLEENVRLWYTRCGSATASALAIQKNWLQDEFAKPGTELLSLREAQSPELRNSHFNHAQSGMFREGGNIPPIWAKASGQDTVVLGITWLDEYQGILVRADSEIHELADLKGKRLGIPLHPEALIDFQRGASQHGFVTALSLVGLTVDDATLVDITWPARRPLDASAVQQLAPGDPSLTALENGVVDAVFIRYARGYRIAQDPKYRQLINIKHLSNPLLRVNNGTPRPITVDRAFLDRHPELVERYLTVLLRTARWAEHNRDEVAQRLLAESGGATVSDVYACHGEDVHLSFTPTLNEASIAGLEVQKNFLRDWHYLKNDFDVRDWLVHEPLQRAQQRLAAEAPLVSAA